jgi:hypothetical protein
VISSKCEAWCSRGTRSTPTPDQILHLVTLFENPDLYPRTVHPRISSVSFDKCFDFLFSFLAFIMSSSAPDSVLDDILAAAELLSVSDGSPPLSPGVARTGGSRATPRRGVVVSEGTVPIESFSVIAIDCSDMAFCFGAMCNRSSFCIKRNCTTKIHAISKMSFAGTSDSLFSFAETFPVPSSSNQNFWPRRFRMTS